jgi:hypothetical protein
MTCQSCPYASAAMTIRHHVLVLFTVCSRSVRPIPRGFDGILAGPPEWKYRVTPPAMEIQSHPQWKYGRPYSGNME